ncbi:CBU_0592 family membrane protein [Streptacidiphilus monticola]|uniref:CBU-0592-like domain-containing protein n=1 Tax=Streptacidiphilus monticola TaxID=2161674 RepID=A0ABW1FWH8_9ACTN
MNEQFVQIAGSVLVLIPFALAQAGRVSARSRSYLLFNLIGSGALAADAALTVQWGFLLLEGTWAVVSLLGLLGVLKGRQPAH